MIKENESFQIKIESLNKVINNQTSTMNCLEKDLLQKITQKDKETLKKFENERKDKENLKIDFKSQINLKEQEIKELNFKIKNLEIGEKNCHNSKVMEKFFLLAIENQRLQVIISNLELTKRKNFECNYCFNENNSTYENLKKKINDLTKIILKLEEENKELLKKLQDERNKFSQNESNSLKEMKNYIRFLENEVNTLKKKPGLT